ncbi:hypothetical protein D3C75_859140 [compost metagenome]
MLANSGVKEIVFHRPYPKDTAKVAKLLQERGLVFRSLEAYEPPSGCVEPVQN